MMEKHIKKCYRDGCDNSRHSDINPYCKSCRSAYQKALRIKRGQDPDYFKKENGKFPNGRPKRSIEEPIIQQFLSKIKG